MTDLVGHFLLFTIVGILMLLAPLVIGRFVRPKLPNAEKEATYECGEPTIGSSYIQFDLRFYTVALLFIIFDVEIAFFFPWAMVYGSATQLADARLEDEARLHISQKLLNRQELAAEDAIGSETAIKLAWTGMVDILVFFGVLLVGFAYVWKRGDLDWVRSIAKQTESTGARAPPVPISDQSREPEAVA